MILNPRVVVVAGGATMNMTSTCMLVPAKRLAAAVLLLRHCPRNSSKRTFSTAKVAAAVKNFDVAGKTAVITGAGSGINLSLARLLFQRSCNVVIGDIALTRSATDFITTSSSFSSSSSSSSPPKVLFHKTDVTSWAALASLMEFTETQFGTCADIVVPGAGVFEPPWSNFYHDTEDQGYKTLEVNLAHPIKLTRMAIRQMLGAGKPGVVCHISSIAGQVARMPTPIYAATKHGISGFVRALGPLEEAVGVKVVAVAPGVIKTPLWTEHPEKLKMISEDGGDVWVEPEEVAEVMLRCIESGEFKGGDIVEVGKGQTRLVKAFNDPGPRGPGHTTFNGHLLDEEALDILRAERKKK